MSSVWKTSESRRGAYTTVAQSEDAGLELRVLQHGDTNTPESKLPGAGLGSDSDPASRRSLDDDEPSVEDLALLRRVPDKLPWSAFLVAIVELCERFAYYGISGPFQNYIANEWHDANGLPGALGLKQTGATALNNFFQFWCYVTPIIGAIVADQFLGKYRTIVYFSIIYMIGIFVLFITSLPVSIENGIAFWGLIVAMFVIGLGTGGIKSNVSPLIAEQYRATKPFIRVTSKGERVIVDPEITVQRIYMIFYMCINVGSLSAIVTTNLELHVGFWCAYLLPLLMFGVGFFVLVSGKKRYVIRPPQGGVIANCFKALWIAVKNRGDINKAKPSYQEQFGRKYQTPWDDYFIEELKTALMACKVFALFPFYWLMFSQMMSNFVSQAGQMDLHGVPNDILQNIDPLTVLILIPIMDRLVYPLLRSKFHINFHPITRITWGFFIGSISMAYAAGLQSKIYGRPPCFEFPSTCPASLQPDGRHKPNDIHIAWQAPAYALIALSEILASVTGLEFAYTKAPENMKSFIMALFLLTSAFGSAMGIFLAPFAKDPYLVWLYAGLAGLSLIAGCLFWRLFGRLTREGVEKEVKGYDGEMDSVSGA